MRQQNISQIFFDEHHVVSTDQTAAQLFARLPAAVDYASAMIECLATSYLIAVMESVCIREMRRHLDSDNDVIVGRHVSIDHRRPIPPGTRLHLCGWVERMGDRSATFRVVTHDDSEMVCEAAITLVAVDRSCMEAIVAIKREAVAAMV